MKIFKPMKIHLKGIILILFIGIFTQLAAQTEKPLPVSYSTTFSFEGLSQDTLFSKAKVWFAQQFEDPSSIIQIEDKEGGKLVGASMLAYSDPRIEYGVEYNTLNGMISYSITLIITDGEVEFVVANFIHRAFPYGSKGIRNSMGLLTSAKTCNGKLYGYNAAEQQNAWEKVKFTVDEFAHRLLNSLNESVNTKSTNR